MNKQVARVLNGYLKMSETDRRDFVTEVNKYIDGDQYTRKSLSEKVTRNASESINFGPAPGNCPCCGK